MCLKNHIKLNRDNLGPKNKCFMNKNELKRGSNYNSSAREHPTKLSNARGIEFIDSTMKIIYRIRMVIAKIF